MKDIEDRVSALLMEYGVLKNADADRLAKRIAGMFEKEQDDLEVKWVDVTARLVTAERERDQIAAKLSATETVLKHNLDHAKCSKCGDSNMLLYCQDCYDNQRDQLAAKFPDIGPDPLKLEGDERKTRYSVEGSKAHLTKASCVQQTGVPDQTAVVWRADLMKVCDDHTWRSVHLPALLEMTKQRDQLAAKCAEMRDAIDRIYNHNKSARSAVIKCCGLHHSDDCGKGWLSPEKAQRLRDELEKCRDFFETRNPAICESIKRTLEETK